MNVLEKLANIDRRYIFLLVGLCVLIPLLLPFGLPTYTTKHAQNLFNEIDSIPPDGPALLLAIDFAPSTAPELMPMARAILRHCFAKNIRVLVLALYAQYTGMAEMALASVIDEYDVKNGEDYVYLMFVPGYYAVMLSIGEDIHRTFPEDFYGNPIDSLPMMRDIHNYDDIALVASVSSTVSPRDWAVYVGTSYHQKIGVGCTAVSAAEFYAFLQSGQFVGMLGGLKGAAEYEDLIERHGYTKKGIRKEASIGMDAQSAVHLMMIALVIFGNIAFFALRRKK